MTKTIITITGPTCSGKSTLARCLAERSGIPEIMSFTTRPQRFGEVDGVHYDFVSKDQAEAYIRDGKAVQYVRLGDNIYGSTIDQVERALADCGVATIVVEPTGVPQFRKAADLLGAQVFAVYIDNPIERLVERYLERVRSDLRTSMPFHAKRLLGLIEEARNWPDKTFYHLTFEGMDDADPESNSLAQTEQAIVWHVRKLREPKAA